MDSVERRLVYARQMLGTQVTREQVLGWIRDGTEDARMTPGQRRRKQRKRGGTRRAQTPRPREAAPEPEAVPELLPGTVEVFGQRWELP
jgi:hypothetical protein